MVHQDTSKPAQQEVSMEGILEMIQGLISRLFGGAAMDVLRSIIDKIVEVIGGFFGQVAPAK